MLLTILIVVDNYKSYRDLLFRHPMFRIAFTLNLLYESIMRVALCRVQHLITAAILYFLCGYNKINIEERVMVLNGDGDLHVYCDIDNRCVLTDKTHGFFLNMEIKTMRRNNSCEYNFG